MNLQKPQPFNLDFHDSELAAGLKAARLFMGLGQINQLCDLLGKPVGIPVEKRKQRQCVQNRRTEKTMKKTTEKGASKVGKLVGEVEE